MGFFNRVKLNRRKQKSFIPPAGVGPLCPHCNGPLDGVFSQELGMPLGKGYVHFCRRCSKVLGLTHRKGFWMG